MGIFASIKKGFSVAVSSLPVVLVLFVFSFIFNLINLKLAPPPAAPNTPPPPPSVPMILVGIVFVLITVFMQAGSMGYIRDKIKKGTAALSDFTGAGSKYYLKVFILSLIVAVVVGIFVLLVALVVALLGQAAKYVALAIAVVLVAVGIFVLVLLFFAPYIAVNEEKKIGECLQKSVKIAWANIMKVLGISAILIIIGFSIGLLIGVIVGLASKAMNGGFGALVLFAFLSSLINSFLGFFVTSSFMSFYLGMPTEDPTSEVQ